MCLRLLALLLLGVGSPLAKADEPLLLFPESSVFQFTIGTSVPIAMDKKGGIVFSSGFQFNYALPWNLTQFEPMVVHARSARQVHQLNLENIYTALEDLLEKHGWRNGRACLLRAICELAERPIVRSGDDVLEEIVHLLLTPSEDAGETDHPSQWSEANSYAEAELLGRNSDGFACVSAYALDCAESPLESFTEIAFGAAAEGLGARP